MTLLKSLFILLLLVSSAHAGERVTVLTLNVAGLPDALTKQDHPKMRMAFIAQRATNWDLVAYQEDFYYSKWLDDYDEFETTLRGGKMTKWAFIWPWLRKSGLTLKTNWENDGRKYHAYKECNGHFKHASDCWVPKGVMCTRTMTPGGVAVDFCTTHLDAGSGDGDGEARRSQIIEYLEFLPVPELDIPYMRVEAGDFNLRLGDEDLDPLLADREIVISNTTGGNNVDFITVTTNNLLTVEVKRSGKVPKFEGLSDHPAIGAILNLEY